MSVREDKYVRECPTFKCNTTDGESMSGNRDNKYLKEYRTSKYTKHEDGSISVHMDYYSIIDDLLRGVPHRLSHAAKKILFAGLRLGKKPVEQDIDEAIWSLESFKERHIEENSFE